MLKVLRAEDVPFCHGGSSTCAGCATIPVGSFIVLSKGYAYGKSKTNSEHDCFRHPLYLGSKYDGVHEGQNMHIGFDAVVCDQMHTHKNRTIGFGVPKFPDPIPIYLKYNAHKIWSKGTQDNSFPDLL